MKIRSFLGEFSHSPIPRLAVVLLAMLPWSNSGLCGPIHDAAQQGDLAQVTALLEGNRQLVSSKDIDGNTPLHLAVMGGHKEVEALLLAREAGVNAKNNTGDTPLHLAARMGYKDIAVFLLNRGADVNAKTSTAIRLCTRPRSWEKRM